MRRFDNGYWARVMFRGASDRGDPLLLSVFGGAYSGYLLRIQGGIDDRKPLTWRLESGHATVVYGDWFYFSLAGLGDDDSLCLGPGDATEWLTARLDAWCPKIESYCSDEALIDLLCRAGDVGESTFWRLRDAALLARHAGMDDLLPVLLERAKEAEEVARRAISDQYAEPIRHDDRSGRYSILWSHDRFLRFMAESPVA